MINKIDLKYIISLSSDLDSINNLINVLQSRSSFYIKHKENANKSNTISAKLTFDKQNIENEFTIQKLVLSQRQINNILF